MTSTGSPVSPVRTFNPEGWPTPYSHSAIAEIPANARIIQISGQVAVDIEGKTPDTFDAQVKLVFENLRECLRTAGGTVKDIVKLNFYVVDHSPEKLVAFGAGLMPFLGDARPASTFIGVVKLAMPEWMVEVECTAAIPDNKVTEKTTEEVDVVVVGAGLSGLEAALNLEKARLSVLVLEAKDRAGGKTCSVSNGAKGVVELGAAWFNNTNQSEMWALSQQYGFDTVHQLAEGLDCVQASDGSVTTRPYGTGTTTEDEKVQVQAFKDWLTSSGKDWDPNSPSAMGNVSKLDSITFKAYCDKYLPGGVASYVAGTCTRGFLGVEPDEISALFMIDYIASGTGIDNMISDEKDGGQYIRNRRGNQQFSQRIASQLNTGSIRLSHPVTTVTQTPSGQCLVTSGTSTKTFSARCKKVVVSVPTALYSHITFSPPLPTAKAALAASTHMGYTSKALCIYDKPWWRELGFSGSTTSDVGPIAFTRDTCFLEDEQYSMVCFIVGEAGRKWSKCSEEEKKRQVISQMKTMFAAGCKEVPEPTSVILQDWSKEEYIWGAPSAVMSLGALAGGAGLEVKKPWRNVHFVGTETSDVWKGYMEGAVRSGRRGAKEIIADMLG